MSQFVLDLAALEHLESQAVQAEGAANICEFRKIQELGENTVAQIHRDGTVILHERKSRRYHSLGNLDSVEAWVNHQCNKESENDLVFDSVVVWADYNRVEVVLDDDCEVRPFDGAFCPLPYSAEFELVRKFAAANQAAYYDQQSFVRLLRSEIGHCLAPPDGLIVDGAIDPRKELIDTFSVLNFKTRTQAAGIVNDNTNFLGRENGDEVSSGPTDRPRSVPTVINLYVRPYRDASYKPVHQIPCELLIDYANCKLGLKVCETVIQQVADEALENVKSWLVSALPDDVPVFTGKP